MPAYRPYKGAVALVALLVAALPMAWSLPQKTIKTSKHPNTFIEDVLADGPQLAAIFAVRHREAPERSRGQVFTTGASLKITAAAIGAALVGQLGGLSLEFTILTACFVQVAAIGRRSPSAVRSALPSEQRTFFSSLFT